VEIIMDKKYNRALTIAGSDSGGGAGIQADLKTFSALGCFGTSAVTAITAQNTVGVNGIHPVPVEMIKSQVSSVLDDIGTDAVKIGMLHSSEVIAAIAEMLIHYRISNVVIDPVMVATSGAVLLQESAINSLKEILIPKAVLITPNIPEAEILIGESIKTQADLPEAVKKLSDLGCPAVMLKAGHLKEDKLVDYFYDKNTDQLIELPSDRLHTQNTHGTGCTLSSAITAFLAKGYSLEKAVLSAKNYLTCAISAGSSYQIGKGHGPVHHFYNFWD
jgi:hydroxymethylpyrimidine/phosphomethylpyrimidine kinase